MNIFTYAEEVLLPELSGESLAELENCADRQGAGARLAELVRRRGELSGFHFPSEETEQLQKLTVQELDLPDYKEHVLVLTAEPIGALHRVYICGTERFERSSLFLVREEESGVSYYMRREGRFETWEGPNLPGTEANGYAPELMAAVNCHRALQLESRPETYGEGSRLRRLIRRFHDSLPTTENDAYAALLEELAACSVLVPADVTPAELRAAARGPLLGRTEDGRLVSAVVITREGDGEEEDSEDFVAVYSGPLQAEELGNELLRLPFTQVLEAAGREKGACGIAIDANEEAFLLRPEEFGYVADIESFWESVFAEEE